MDIEYIVQKLKAKRIGIGSYQAHCPNHDDSKASLSVSEKNGKVLMYCHAGCDIKDVVHASGLEMKDLFTPDGNGKMEIVATYDYADENGVLIYQVVRYSNKTFRQRKALDNGEWEWNLKGVKRVPYRLPSIIKNANKRIIIIVEGEKDVHTLLEAGARCVTTNSGGAGKWIADYNQFFKGANVVAIPDNDSPGLDHMYNVCNNLFDHAKSVRLVKLTGLKDKQDVSDWLKDHSLEELLDITEKTPVRTFTPMPNPKQKFEIEENSIKHFHLTDTGNANRLVKLFGQKIRYCKTPMKKLFIWSDSCWKIDTTDMIYEFADLTVRSLYKEAANIEDKEERKKLIKFAGKCERARAKKDMIFLASKEQCIAIEGDDLDKEIWKFNVQNGTLNFKKDGKNLDEPEFLQHNPEDYITKIAPAKYDPNAECPEWDKFLLKIFNNDTELIKYVKRILGYSLTGDTSEQCLFFAIGSGANGKSVFFKAMQETVFGTYAGKAPSEMIMQQRFSQIPTDVADLKGKRFVICSEIEENKRLNESRVKDITGGDSITARHLHQDYFEFDATFKLFIYGNHKPVIHGNDNGMWRRIILILFNTTIAKEDQIPMHKLLEKFSREKSGILNWAIEGYCDYILNGLSEPKSVQNEIFDYKSEMDIVGRFIEECCEKVQGERTLAKHVYEAFTSWTEENGEVELKNRTFYNKIKKIEGFDIIIGNANKREIKGLKLNLINSCG